MMPGLASAEYLRLGGQPPAALEQVFLRGVTPDPDRLAGWEFRGMNIAFWAPYSPIQKFVKGFYREPGGALCGFNEPVVQNGPRSAWIAKPRDDDPKRFGFYTVEPVDPASRDNAYLHALLLDYGRGGNFPLDPASRLRDYLIQVEPGCDDLLLGKAYLALGHLRVASNYFLLERHRESAWVRNAP